MSLQDLFHKQDGVRIQQHLAEVLSSDARAATGQETLLRACQGSVDLDTSGFLVPNWPKLPANIPGRTHMRNLGLDSVLPLATFLAQTYFQSPKAEQLVHHIAACLRHWHNERPAKRRPWSQWRDLMLDLYSTLRRLIDADGMPAAHKTVLSSAVREMLLSIVGDQAAGQVVEAAAGLKSALFGDALPELQLPLLPTDAVALLQQLHDHILDPKETSQGYFPAEDFHIILAARLVDCAAKERSLPLPLAQQLRSMSVRKLQQAVHVILSSIEHQPSDTDSLEESIQNLQIPSTSFVRAAAKIAASTVVYEVEAMSNSSVPSKSTELQSQNSEHLKSSRGGAASGSLQADELQRRQSEDSARLRTRQASRSALKAASRRMRQMDEGTSQSAESLEGVVNFLLDVMEGCLAFCWEVGLEEVVSHDVLEITTAVTAQLKQPLCQICQAVSSTALDDLARLRAVALSSALLATTECTSAAAASKMINGGHNSHVDTSRHMWHWGLHSGLAGGPSSSNAEALCRQAIEVLSAALAVSWQRGVRLAVDAVFAPLADAAMADESVASAEYQAMLLSMGWLVACLQAEEGILKLAIPLVADCLLPGAAPEVIACACQVLAALAAAAAKSGHRWAYEQAVNVLVKGYKLGGGPIATALLFSSPRSSFPGTLASALQDLAQQLKPANQKIRLDFEMKLLSLFSDVALEARSEAQLRDLGSLLPAIADAWHEGQPPSTRLLMSSTSMDFEALQQHQRADSQLVKLYRMLWIYIAVHELAKVTPSKTHKRQWPSQWRQAAIRIAQGPTPLLVAGGEMDVDQVEAEFSERLRQLSKAMSPLKLATRLLDGIKSGQVPAAGLVASAGHPARNAHLLSTLVLNLLRVELAPHQLFSAPPSGCPLAPLFATQQVASSKSWELPWLTAMTERVFHVYLDLLCNAALTAEGAEAVLVGERQVALAQTLVQNLRNKGTNRSARDLADKLLEKLLDRCTALLWQSGLIGELLAALEAKDASGYQVTVDSRIIVWLRKVIERGTVAAPGFTEALLHEHLRQEPDDSNTQAMQESQNLMAILRQARARSPLALLEGPPSGVVALNRKAHFGGILSGIVACAQESGRPGEEVLDTLAKQLQEAAAPGGSKQALHDRLLAAAAGLIRYPGSAKQLELLHAVCWVPAASLHPATLRLAVFAWHWIAACAPQLQVCLLSEVVSAWLWTCAQRQGLYADDFDPEALEQSTEPESVSTDVLQDDSLEAKISSVAGICGHHIWLIFLLEAWKVWGTGLGPNSSAIAAVIGRWAHQSLQRPAALTKHPAAAGARFRLLLLALRYARHMEAVQTGELATAMLYERILQTALSWFDAPPAYFAKWSPAESREELAAFLDFAAEIDSIGYWPCVLATDKHAYTAWRRLAPDVPVGDRLQLLRMLLRNEAERLQVWADPLGVPNRPTAATYNAASWQSFARTAWNCEPHLAINLIERFPKAAAFRAIVAGLVAASSTAWKIQSSAKAADLLASSTEDAAAIAQLQHWAPAHLLQSLSMMSGPQGRKPSVRAYALRSLHTCPPEQVAFFLPQLVQLLRSDDNGMIQDFLLDSAGRSIVFAHHLVCTLRSEGTPPEDAFAPAVKRSGWQPPQDSGLWKIADSMEHKVWKSLAPDIQDYLRAELAFFDTLTNVSGRLYPVPKDERKAAAVRLVREVEVPRSDLYLPTNPGSRVLAVIPESATPMQSAAKVPILVAFKVEDKMSPERVERVQACLFKVGDDCRQDVLALQVIGLLKDTFQKAGLGLYLAPYGVLPTSYECGIIEIVPNSKSRSALGETSDGGLLDIWCREFGAPGTETFEQARRNFIVSEAGYAIACYLLQAKDRHNGNILVDALGHLVHIDFGFILEISPGGNLGFESAAFKLSHEMTQLLDPSGKRTSPQFRLFQEQCIRGYLAARTVAEGIIATVQLMSASGLPCYSRGAPLGNLRKRFHLEMSDAQAAAFMRHTIADAYDKWTTGFYDFVQYLQNSIPK